MKIWQVTARNIYQGMTVIRYFATKKTAWAHYQDVKTDGGWDRIDMVPIDVEPTRVGIAKAMQAARTGPIAAA